MARLASSSWARSSSNSSAEKTGKFLPADLRGRFRVLEWLAWQIGGLGPMAGQVNHFVHYAQEKLPYAMDRYVKEVSRLFAVMDKQLASNPYLAGDFSIADMASYPWTAIWERQQQKIEDFPHVKRWLDTMRDRPGVKAAYEKAKAYQSNRSNTDPDVAKIVSVSRRRQCVVPANDFNGKSPPGASFRPQTWPQKSESRRPPHRGRRLPLPLDEAAS